MLQRPQSEKIYQKLCEVIPGGVNSPVRACKSVGQLPLVALRGKTDMVYDVDENPYIDYCGSWGALIHGHAHPAILDKVHQRMLMGTTFGMTTPIEEALARKITSFLPSIEQLRFVSSGSEATMSAIRLARGFTGRPIVIKFEGNYHGHADFLLVKAGSGLAEIPTSTSAGIPDDIVKHTVCIPFNDKSAIKNIFAKYTNQIACLIVEPIAGNMGVVLPKPGFLELLREETQRHGSLLIFDEVITGFRVSKKSVQGMYHISPDLTCLGKIIGGGFPAAAFGGRREIMNKIAPLGPVYQGGTLSGNPVAMEAGLQALNLLDRPGFYEELERKTQLLIKPIQEWISKRNLNACIQACGSMFTLFFGKKEVRDFEDAKACNMEQFGSFFRYMFQNGVYIPPLQVEAWFISSAHTDENLIKTRDLVLKFFS